MKYLNINEKAKTVNEDQLSHLLSNIDFKVYSVGIWNSNGLKKDAYYTINDIEFILYTKGTSVTTIKEAQYKCEVNDIMLLEPHHLYNSKNPEQMECEYYFIHFEVSPINLQNDFLNLFKHPIVKLNDYKRIDQVFKLIMEEEVNKKPGYLMMINNYLKMIIIEFFRDQHNHLESTPTNDFSANNVLLNQCVEYIQNNIGNDLSNQTLAKLFDVSPSTLNKSFIENLKISPNNYVVEQRILRAKTLIAYDQFKLEDIAQKVGYSSLASFSRTFKKHLGISPIEFRKRSTNNN